MIRFPLFLIGIPMLILGIFLLILMSISHMVDISISEWLKSKLLGLLYSYRDKHLKPDQVSISNLNKSISNDYESEKAKSQAYYSRSVSLLREQLKPKLYCIYCGERLTQGAIQVYNLILITQDQEHMKPKEEEHFYCMYCGERLPQELNQSLNLKALSQHRDLSKIKKMENLFCMYCGAKLKKGLDFCLQCGTIL